MKLRPFSIDTDFEALKSWMADERAHALWCADILPCPPERGSLSDALRSVHERSGDLPYAAVMEDGRMAGFFCYSFDQDTKEGMLKFVIVNPALRGTGIAQEMLRLALSRAFDNYDTEAVQLNVFTANTRARKCYEKAGFTERRTDENAFPFRDETWGRCNMIFTKSNLNRILKQESST